MAAAADFANRVKPPEGSKRLERARRDQVAIHALTIAMTAATSVLGIPLWWVRGGKAVVFAARGAAAVWGFIWGGATAVEIAQGPSEPPPRETAEAVGLSTQLRQVRVFQIQRERVHLPRAVIWLQAVPEGDREGAFYGKTTVQKILLGTVEALDAALLFAEVRTSKDLKAKIEEFAGLTKEIALVVIGGHGSAERGIMLSPGHYLAVEDCAALNQLRTREGEVPDLYLLSCSVGSGDIPRRISEVVRGRFSVVAHRTPHGGYAPDATGHIPRGLTDMVYLRDLPTAKKGRGWMGLCGK